MSAESVLVWGATSQARVLRPILETTGYVIGGFYDDDPKVDAIAEATPLMLADRSALRNWIAERRVPRYVVAIGGHRGRIRCEIGALLSEWGLAPAAAVHPTASIAPSVEIGPGAQLLRSATVSENAVIGGFTIINTAASIDHDCILGEGVHVMPGAVLTGCVTVERHATIGANATVLPHVRIGEGAMIGAGAVVTRDIPPHAVAVGVPARIRDGA